MAVFKVEAQRARLDARVLEGRKAWLIEQVSGYIAYYGRRGIDEVDMPSFLEGLGIDPDQFGDREDG